ncbi:hypothetical protein [Leptospira weilii]|uniref:hypothetical protein n=1 Tax=Leptospira weilii TaxID=28184 RepID=UPI0002FCCEFF|nr:hypothetical protein [Leptospira weilii]
MRKFLLCFLFIILFFNCRSIGVQNIPEPSRILGCSRFKGPEWFRCLETLHERWERIESAAATITVLSESREGEYVRTKKRICWSENFCHMYDQVTYKPSYWQTLKEVFEIAVPSFAIGLLIGLSL